MGVPVTGTITPTDPIDIYATTDPLTGIDSWRSVADHTARNAITSLRRRQGMAVWTQNDGFLWTLNAAPWAFDDTDWTQFSGGGGSPACSISQVQTNLDGAAFGAIGGQGGTTDSVPLGTGCLALGVQSLAATGSLTNSAPSQATTDNSVSLGSGCIAGDPPRTCTISGTTVTIPGGNYTGWFYGNDDLALCLSQLTGGTGDTIVYASIINSGGVVFTGGNTVLTLKGSVTTHTAGFANMHDDNTNCFAAGSNAKAQGYNSFAIGAGTLASGAVSYTEGSGTTASGSNSHAEGNNSIASGNNCHAEGNTSTASGDGSHAEGASTASGTNAHAEGNSTLASQTNAHAEGSSTTASGTASHAEGQGGTASGKMSHAAGFDSLADLQAKVAWGGGQFAAQGDCQSSLITLSATTTDATPVLLQVQDTPSSVLIRAGVAYGFRATIVGRKTDGSELAMFMRSGIIQNLSGTTAMVGDVSTIGADNNVPAWAITITADNGSSSLFIHVTGEVSTTIRWVCTLEAAEVG